MGFDRGLPFERYEYIEIEFLEPDQSLRVPHRLAPERPDDVIYFVVGNDGDGVIYDARRFDPDTEWTVGSIVLRASRAPCTVVLLLAVRRAV
jgi:hypothetical protein